MMLDDTYLMNPPKVRYLRPNKVFGVPKSFLGPKKTQKIDFLKILDLCDLAAHSQGLPQYPDRAEVDIESLLYISEKNSFTG